MNHEDKTVSGFTLLEIMVALVILSGGLVLVMRASHNVLDTLYRSSETIRAGQLLRERMDGIRGEALVNPETALRSGSGRFAPPFDEYEWSLTVNDLDEAQGGRFVEVTVVVRRIDGFDIRSATGFLFVPRD